MTMTYRVLLRDNPTNGYIATSLAWPACVVAAPTREEQITGRLAVLRRTQDPRKRIQAFFWLQQTLFLRTLLDIFLVEAIQTVNSLIDVFGLPVKVEMV